ncbi:Trm112 family protein [Asticcacaulis sp. DW145]|jgi:uncharacterized protein|uniref:UPF0434 protein PQU94_01085 n=1 Tax=Asticcacaulis currens TaxID=2984210 RepID=A0ABT5I9M0_9CAUL|nr:Trm112 family protein [Asticcacaulis currens]MDC7692867.1 Trm112 family protein [Asticcacaulis currens]BEV11664.1 Trm112 family protein [Asticcacaulis sp. DW145]
MAEIEIETPASDSPVPDTSEIDPRLLEALVCPVTRRALTYDRVAQELVSPTAGLAFPIRSGVPIMLVDQARRFEPQKT